LSKTDLEMKMVKTELTDSANLLLLHKGLPKHLQQLRIERHPVISKTKNFFKLQKKYDNYINSVDAIRDTVGKLKVQSVKIKEGIGKWKHQQKISNELLQKFLQSEDSDANYSFDDDDCLETSSCAPEDEHFDIMTAFVNFGPRLLSPLIQIINVFMYIVNENVLSDCIFRHVLYKRLNINLMFVTLHPRNMTFLWKLQ